MNDDIGNHAVVTHEEWVAARIAFLAREKEFTRSRDELSRARRELPWEEVSQPYLFEGEGGKLTLDQLFAGKSQLIVYHFMFGPDWEAGCKSCSFWADNFNGIDIHLAQRDTRFLAISHAPFAKLAAYKKRMGWSFDWVSSFGSDFNFDYDVSFSPESVAAGTTTINYGSPNLFGEEIVGVSVFFKRGDNRIFHTYSTYSRGVDMLNGAYHYLDLTPKGRDEQGRNQYWVRRHDEY